MNKIRNRILILIIVLTLIHRELDCNTKISERPSITFIYAKDNHDQYAQSAVHYFKFDEVAKTTYINQSCRSFLEMTIMLRNLSECHAHPWGRINIVTHGNPWTGLSLPGLPNGPRLTKDELMFYLVNEKIHPLSDQVVDHNTEVHIKACGVGSNPELLEVMSLAIGGIDIERPRVNSSEEFIWYGLSRNGLYEEKKFQPFYSFYKTAFRPAYSTLAVDLKSKYPNEKLDWLNILLNPEVYENIEIDRFNVPIVWHHKLSNPFKKEDYDSDRKIYELIERDNSLLQIINEFQIPIQRFRWTIVDSPDDDPYTIIIKGKATVLCILQKN